MSKQPTDREILKRIYQECADAFNQVDLEEPESRSRLIYLPIDVNHIAGKLGMNQHLLYGRLYFHLDHKYRYTQADGGMVHLFAKKVGKDINCINYPYLAAIVSERDVEHKRNLRSLQISIISICIASVTAAVTIVAQIKGG